MGIRSPYSPSAAAVVACRARAPTLGATAPAWGHAGSTASVGRLARRGLIETARITDYVATESGERSPSPLMGRIGWQAVTKLTAEADEQRDSA